MTSSVSLWSLNKEEGGRTLPPDTELLATYGRVYKLPNSSTDVSEVIDRGYLDAYRPIRLVDEEPIAPAVVTAIKTYFVCVESFICGKQCWLADEIYESSFSRLNAAIFIRKHEENIFDIILSPPKRWKLPWDYFMDIAKQHVWLKDNHITVIVSLFNYYQRVWRDSNSPINALIHQPKLLHSCVFDSLETTKILKKPYMDLEDSIIEISMGTMCRKAIRNVLTAGTKATFLS